MKNEQLQEVIMYTDGSCLDNGNNGTGGYCALLQTPDKAKQKIIKGSELDTTNNRMEITAIIEGLKAIKKPSKVTVYSDSNITVRAINEWLEGWIKKNFRRVANVDLWKEYLEVSNKHQVKAIWVKAHSGIYENELVDDIARDEAMKLHSKRDVLYEY
ncbi:ribonuclease HI [Halarcobacter sp.]|uniref:ribonuclease H family protein n=1 Tax=Halarcobacter sp. TaxID=2321133 RepID=UPI0029F595FC|nr:ribonuclease HI [Halarcobacter sp.]